MKKEKACQEQLWIAHANKPQNRYVDKVKMGNWREDRIQRQYQGDILANTQPPVFDWDIVGKVGSFEDEIRKREYQAHIVEKMEGQSDKKPYNLEPCEASREDKMPYEKNTLLKPVFGKDTGLPIKRHQAAYYNELDDPRMNNVWDKDDVDNSNGMKTYFERSNHHMYEGYEPAYKTPAICQHKKDFFPVNINWGLGLMYRKKLALREMQRKHPFITNYQVDYCGETWSNIKTFPYQEPECLLRQKPLVMYRRAEMGVCAEMPFSPLQQLHPPKSITN